MKKLIITLFILLSIIISSCSDDLTTFTKNFKQEIPATVTEKIILPRIDLLIQKTSILKLSIDNFVADASANNLQVAQNNLKEVSIIYAKLYIFNIGKVKDRFMNRRINFWPVFNISIEKNVEEGNFNKESIAKLGSATKNLPGLHYLLFKYDNNQTILDEYTTNSNRKDFLTFVSDEFQDNIKQLHNIWAISGDNFSNDFTINNEEGLQSSFNQLYNGIYNVLNVCKIKKIGKPAGLEKSNHINAEIVENFYANNSLDLVYNNLVSLEEVFFRTDITSISEYVKSITKNDELNTTIQTTINTAKSTIKLINNPLKVAITEDKANVEKLHNTLKELLVLLHTDVRSNLSIIITGTDTDGD